MDDGHFTDGPPAGHLLCDLLEAPLRELLPDLVRETGDLPVLRVVADFYDLDEGESASLAPEDMDEFVDFLKTYGV